MDTWQVAGVLAVTLLFGRGVTNAAEVSAPAADRNDTFDFDIPALPLRNATQAFAKRIGRDTYIGHRAFESCRDFIVGPVVGRFTAKEAWRKLTAPICAASGSVIERPGEPPVYMVDHPWVAEREIRIPRAPLIEALSALSSQFDDLPVEYWARDLSEGQTLVGPIAGRFNPEEALQRIEAQLGSGLRHRRDGPYVLVLDSGDVAALASTRHYLYGRQCFCPVRIEPVSSGEMTVEAAPIVDRDSPGNLRFTRKQIESTGATTLPQFFRYLAISGYSRPDGYIASGAQYADFRGLGRDTHLVTINGRRTLPSANNVSSSAFDLNTIPLPAVEHVDLRLDSASMRAGADAIAGTIDIVTRRELEGAVELRYGFADGGAEERRTTLSAGHRGDAGGFAALFDWFELGGLLDNTRPLSREQDYTRFGGMDFRNAFAIYSIDGANLPGLPTPFAGVPAPRVSDTLSISELPPGEPQRVSLSSYQSLAPSGTRASAVGAADYEWRGLEFAADLLSTQRKTAYQYFPAIVSGEVSKDLPGNPFDARVWIDAPLTGAPSMAQHIDSELGRGVFSVRGPVGPWEIDLAAIRSRETAEAWVDHTLDPIGTQAALEASDADLALDVFARRPGADAPATIWADPIKQRFSSSGTHLVGSLAGPIFRAHLQLGLEARREAMQFDALVGRVERDVHGRFAHLTVPLVHPENAVPGVRELTALAGVRHDGFSDGQTVTRTHGEIQWRVTDQLVIDANLAQQYRPPSLFELRLPTVEIPVQIYDPARDEAATVVLLSGGNQSLRPTTGKSTHLKVTYSTSDEFSASLNYFSIRLWDRIAVLPVPFLLAAEAQCPDRVGRDEPTAEDVAAGRPGRITFVNTSQVNVGRLFTQGWDFSIRKRFETAGGAFTPQVDFTWIDRFEYSDSPAADAPMTDRVGLASEQGTITPWRAVASLGWQRGPWEATTFLRLIPAYHDVDGSRIGSQQLWDLNVSYAAGPHVTFTLGAIAAALRPIYAAATLEAAHEALEDFASGGWGQKYPTIVQSWRRAWEHVIPFFAFPPEVRRIVYTTNMIESLHMQLRKIIKNRGHFPSDEAAIKLLWLALRNINDGKVRSAREWKLAMNQFAVLYGDRFVSHAS
jgi:outer membrane receptor protein involved in Fe transport